MLNIQRLNLLVTTFLLTVFNPTASPLSAQTLTSNQITEKLPTIPQRPRVPSLLPEKQEPIIQPFSPSSNPLDIHNKKRLTLKVERFVFQGNTVIDTSQLEAVVAPFIGRKIIFPELYQVRTAITQLYVKRGYITSAAFISTKGNEALDPNKAVITIQVLEGKLEKIKVIGGSRLHNYIRERLPNITEVVNEKRLVEALQLLQQDPLIESITAQLDKGSQLNKSILNVRVKERQPFTIYTVLDNFRSPAIGSTQRRIELTNANLLGLGDKLSVGYRNTDGSNTLTTTYSIPLNPQNGTLGFSYINSSSNIIEYPFTSLDILANARAYELTLRQPLVRRANAKSIQEFALGVTASRTETESSLLNTPYPLVAGADSQGQTRISALRFFQDWIQRDQKGALLLHSQFSLGVGAFGATVNNSAPDGRFFTWLGQVVWLKHLANSTTLVTRAELQLADRPLAALEQVASGGADSVRGYREASFLTDNAFLFSTELLITTWKKDQQQLRLIPFFDIGTAWNNDGAVKLSSTQATGTLASVGLGLQYQWGERFHARLDWGIPLIFVDTNSDSKTWQENGVYFSIDYRLF